MNHFFDTVEFKSVGKGVKIHPTAVVAKGAEFGEDVVVGPFAVIGPKVKISDRAEIGAYCAIEGRTFVGAETKVFSHATLGTPPQDLKYKGEDSRLEIGSQNAIREYANISIGTEGGGGVTRIGNGNLIMAYTHVAHDCVIKDHCIFANGVQIAGHVEIGDHVVFGGMSGGHQFCRFGEGAMVGAGAIVVQDVPPYCMVQGDRASINGLNMVGLRRSGIKAQNLKDIKDIFKALYRENLTIEDALLKIKEQVADSPYKSKFLEFLGTSKRGICR